MAGRAGFVASVVSVFALTAGVTCAQSVISAKSGLVHYVEGDVTLDDKAVEMKNGQFPEIKEQQVLKTGEGRAEILLTPGTFLRVAENSSFRLLSNRLTDTRVEALSGSMLIEFDELNKDTQVTLVYKEKSISFLKSGLYRLDAETGNFRVYQGEARVAGGGGDFTVKQAREIQLGAAVLVAAKFDSKVGDEFYRWASRRASYLALANISAAKTMRDSGMRLTSGMWYWNPWFGMFTYIPYGYSYSPFGYAFWSPSRVGQLYQRPVFIGGGGGGGYSASSGRFGGGGDFGAASRGASSMGSMGGASMGSIGGAASAPSAAPASHGGAASGGSTGGSRGGEATGGGRGR